MKRQGARPVLREDASDAAPDRRTRNAIEHYEWRTTEQEAKVVIGNALSFALAFANDNLGIDLSEELKRDDTWKAFIDELFEFVLIHGKRLEKAFAVLNAPFGECEMCGSGTVSLNTGACYVCGHWQSIDDASDD